MMIVETVKQRLHAIVEGRVQGVGFRYFVIMFADKNDLRGWVGNRMDGSVEVTAEGSFIALEGLLSSLRKGPSGAHVNDVRYTWSDPTDEFHSFSVHNIY
ncbi:MAG: acylphosphatase [Anaerolineales bacterium]|nr:acylphosphatase [Anaerolineales bacterium]